MSEYDYEFEYDPVYCYPNSNVLKNKLGIRDQEILTRAERDITFLKYTGLISNPPGGVFDKDFLRTVHRILFSDLYDWAGEFRTVNISKGTSFCRHEYIETNLDVLFEKLAKEDFQSMEMGHLAATLAHYLGEINAVHPFREGNGRTQRAFVNLLALKYGYSLDFSLIKDEEMLEASYHSFSVDDSKMIALFERIIRKI